MPKGASGLCDNIATGRTLCTCCNGMAISTVLLAWLRSRAVPSSPIVVIADYGPRWQEMMLRTDNPLMYSLAGIIRNQSIVLHLVCGSRFATASATSTVVTQSTRISACVIVVAVCLFADELRPTNNPNCILTNHQLNDGRNDMYNSQIITIS